VADPGQNLALVLELWGQVSIQRTLSPLLQAMAEDVVWEGLAPDLVCRGKREVGHRLGPARGGQLPRVTRLEALEVADHVVVTMGGAGLPPAPVGDDPDDPADRTRSFALSFEDGKIVRLRSFGTREEAMSALTGGANG
jgi:ketosteroid isomerase-like protein